jgi:hypothetical protein
VINGVGFEPQDDGSVKIIESGIEIGRRDPDGSVRIEDSESGKQLIYSPDGKLIGEADPQTGRSIAIVETQNIYIADNSCDPKKQSCVDSNQTQNSAARFAAKPQQPAEKTIKLVEEKRDLPRSEAIKFESRTETVVAVNKPSTESAVVTFVTAHDEKKDHSAIPTVFAQMASSVNVSTGQSSEVPHPFAATQVECSANQGSDFSYQYGRSYQSAATYSVETRENILEGSKLATAGFVDRTVDFILQSIKSGSNQLQQNKDGQVPLIEDRQHMFASHHSNNKHSFGKVTSHSHFVHGHPESRVASLHAASPLSNVSHVEGMYAGKGDLTVFLGSPTFQQSLHTESGLQLASISQGKSDEPDIPRVGRQGDTHDHQGDGEHREHKDGQSQSEHEQEEMVA